jgi:hypothetical protein
VFWAKIYTHRFWRMGISKHMLYQGRFYSRKSVAVVKELQENNVKVMRRRYLRHQCIELIIDYETSGLNKQLQLWDSQGGLV